MRARILLLLTTLFVLLATAAQSENHPYGVRVVVLDAGHGGNDPGAVYGGLREKDITLKVVLRLGKMIEQGMPGVKVVYTRKTDKVLAPTKVEDLQKRADIANKAEGDLFISVHVNAARSTTARGVETLIMGESPKEQRYNENALFESNRDDLLDMSDERQAAIIRAYIQNLQFTYGEYSETMARCIQKNYQQAGYTSRGVKPQLLRVLYATNMPGVLTEIGFLSNKEDMAYLKSDKGLNRIVQSIYESVRDYSDYVLGMRRAEEGSTVQVSVPALGEEPAAQRPNPTTKPASAPAAKPTVAPAAKPAASAKPATAKPAAKPVATPAEKPAKSAAAEKPKRSETKLYDPRLYAAAKAVIEDEEKRPTVQVETPKPAERNLAGRTIYTVQILASRKPLSLQASEFKSYRGRVHQYEGAGAFRYKYGVGKYKSKNEAIDAAAVIHKEFPSAFIVAIEEPAASK